MLQTLCVVHGFIIYCVKFEQKIINQYQTYKHRDAQIHGVLYNEKIRVL